MALLPQRRHRKSSPQPNPSRRVSSDAAQYQDSEYNGSPTAAASSAPSYRRSISSGLGSLIGRARRRWNSSYDVSADASMASNSNYSSSSTLLPTTYSSSSSTMRSAGASTCNNFLMGGQFYPGKDKKRRHMRKKTLWYRAFCSSPLRQGCSFLVSLYVLIWHVMIPGTNWLLEVGQQLSNPSPPSPGTKYLTHKRSRTSSRERLQYDNKLEIPQNSLEEEQALVKQIESHRRSPQSDYGSKRLRLLEKIAPAFYHRNDPPIEVDQQNKHQSKAPAAINEMSQNDAKKDSAIDAEKRIRLLEKHNQEIKTSGSSPFRTLKNMDLLSASHSSCSSVISNKSDWSTTLVIQTSVDRLWIIKETCSRWLDPIIVVVYVPAHDTEERIEEQLNAIDNFQSTTVTEHCPHVRIIRYIPEPDENINGADSENSGSTSHHKYYPVNRLRNIGLDHVQTSHVMVMDIDFVPSQNLHHTIQNALRHQDRIRNEYQSEGKFVTEDRQALIVPAFERQPPEPCETESDCANYLQSNSGFLPHTFDELHNCYTTESKDCIVFQSRVNWEGHFSTRSQDWLEKKWYQTVAEVENDNGGRDNSIESKSLKMLECFHSARYEPYVVLRWCPSSTSPSSAQLNDDTIKPVAPYYDERFYGYGKNKIELISQLRFMGYQFYVLPEGFIIHNPHLESNVKETWNTNHDGNNLHGKMDKLYQDIFLKELATIYGSNKADRQKMVKLC